VAYVQQGEIANALAASGLLLRKEPQNPDIPAFLRDLLLEASPRLDDYGWLSPTLATRLNNEQQLQSYITTAAPAHKKIKSRQSFMIGLRTTSALPLQN